MSDKFILDGKAVVAEPDLMKWAMWLESADRTVSKFTKDGVTVSTVFLGLDHSFGESEKPVVFETMVFGGDHDGYQNRCSTWDEAILMHDETMRLVTK